ncbi:HBL004Wp [Eremothecium sinecaudum]|uniref:HBL004Wp n=1 Tax=Eremothecium sinecaudum TaxID=45286 RepID=A0A109UWL6_9SACH|nr:HBL004Wp [Eremothecium sinecaudum]AMD18898.1 HBL004Wp [Eremothecium sinecaudum]
MSASDPLLQFEKHIKHAKKILCVAGAGLSASSGIPTFQSMKGTWRGFTSLDLATPEAFHDNPSLVWIFYSARRYTAMKAKPNNGHFALAELSKRLKDANKDILIVSQNVDGLLKRAGLPSETEVELHGSLFDYRCTEFHCSFTGRNDKSLFLTPILREVVPREAPKLKPCSTRSDLIGKQSVKRLKVNREGEYKTSTLLDDLTNSSDFEPLPQIDVKEGLPLCPKCQGLLRPGVVWYGESLPLCQMDKVDQFISTGGKVDLVFVIGTSGKVWPAMGYVERVKKSGGHVAIFNTDIQNIDDIRNDKHTWGFQGDAVELLPKVLQPIIGIQYKPRDYLRR